MILNHKKITFTLFIVLTVSIFALNITFASAVSDGTKTLTIAAADGDGFIMYPEDGEQITVDWTCSASVKAYIVTDDDYTKAVNGGTVAHLAAGEGATGQITATVVEGGRYWTVFLNDNAAEVTVEATYNTGGINWPIVAGIVLIIAFVIVGVIAALKGYVFQDHGDGTVSWKKN